MLYRQWTNATAKLIVCHGSLLVAGVELQAMTINVVRNTVVTTVKGFLHLVTAVRK